MPILFLTQYYIGFYSALTMIFVRHAISIGYYLRQSTTNCYSMYQLSPLVFRQRVIGRYFAYH